MPRGLIRIHGGGNLHFITTSCYRREPLLGSARARDVFIEIFEQVRKSYGCEVIGFVVMPEHIHILISEPKRKTIPIVMQVLKQRVALRLLRKRDPVPSARSGSQSVSTFGSHAPMISTCIPTGKSPRSCFTCIEIRYSEDWFPRLSCGGGAVIGHLLSVRKEW
jgi:REP element-mobilizing transposase RayT